MTSIAVPARLSRAALYRQIKTEVTRLCGDARMRPILVVDEAHHLRPDVLEDLRLLTNYQMDAEPRLCLLLLGQTELRRRLTMTGHEASPSASWSGITWPHSHARSSPGILRILSLTKMERC